MPAVATRLAAGLATRCHGPGIATAKDSTRGQGDEEEGGRCWQWAFGLEIRGAGLDPLEPSALSLPSHISLPPANLTVVWLHPGRLAQSEAIIRPACRWSGLGLS